MCMRNVRAGVTMPKVDSWKNFKSRIGMRQIRAERGSWAQAYVSEANSLNGKRHTEATFEVALALVLAMAFQALLPNRPATLTT